MAAPRTAYLVHLETGGAPVLVLTEADAKAYPGQLASQAVVVIRGDANDEYYVLSDVRHQAPDSAPFVFDPSAAQTRKTFRDAARTKLTADELDACGLGEET